MAIVDPTSYLAFTGNVFSGADLTALTSICTAVDAALKRILYPYLPETVTITQQVYDAPLSRDLLVCRPVQSITNLWLNENAGGVVANFDLVNDLLVQGQDYALLLDDPIGGLGRAGIVRRIDRNVWGTRWYGQPATLSRQLTGARGAVLISYVAGEVTVNPDVQQAAVSAVTLMMNRRVTGAPLSSESWNGYSASLAPAYTADAAIRSPDVQRLLQPYMVPKFG